MRASLPRPCPRSLLLLLLRACSQLHLVVRAAKPASDGRGAGHGQREAAGARAPVRKQFSALGASVHSARAEGPHVAFCATICDVCTSAPLSAFVSAEQLAFSVVPFRRSTCPMCRTRAHTWVQQKAWHAGRCKRTRACARPWLGGPNVSHVGLSLLFPPKHCFCLLWPWERLLVVHARRRKGNWTPCKKQRRPQKATTPARAVPARYRRDGSRWGSL